MKTLLIKAPEGKGYYLFQQNPALYVSGRPYVVVNNPQVQLASARNCVEILGETTMTDADFEKAYTKDAEKAIHEALAVKPKPKPKPKAKPVKTAPVKKED